MRAPLAVLGLALAVFAAPVLAQDSSGIARRLMQQTGVHHRTGTTPDFVVDPAWPQKLPHHWILGQIGGVFVDRHDHVWVLQNPRTLSNDETGLDTAIPGTGVSGLGFARPNGAVADCCHAAPSVLEFDADGKLLQAWGGAADPGYLEKKCRKEDGCIWPNSEHGIYVDHNGNVWLGGSNPGRAPADQTAWTTNREGPDGFVQKFDRNGNFKLRIGAPAKGVASNDAGGGVNGTPQLFRAADMVVDPATNRLYVADGYGNRRILIVDANTGKYIGHFGAYGNSPVDDAAAAAAGPWLDDAARGNTKPAFFRNPVHCVKIAADGRIYVCDRGNNRVQVFDGKSPELGKPCSNPGGVTGKCGFVTEQHFSAGTQTMPVLPGTAVAVGFSNDKGQSCLYVGDNSNMTIYILNRENLHELGRLGRNGKTAGQFHWLHQLSVDSRGNIYTGEVDNGKRVQKFLRYGAAGCSGTGSATVGGVLK